MDFSPAFGEGEVKKITGVGVILTSDGADADYTETKASAFFLTEAGYYVKIHDVELDEPDEPIDGAARAVKNIVNDGQGIEQAIQALETRADTTIELENLRAVITDQDSGSQTITGITVNDQTIQIEDFPLNIENTDTDTYYTSIQSAIDNADVGDTIDVEAGEYEGFTLEKDVNVVGPNADTPGTGDRSDEATIEGRVQIKAQGVSLQGFTVDSNSGSAVDVDAIDEQAGVSISNNILEATDQDQVVEVQTSADVDIENNLISSGLNGVLLSDAATDVKIDNNKIEDISDGTQNYVDGAAFKIVGATSEDNIEISSTNSVENAEIGIRLEDVTGGVEVESEGDDRDYISLTETSPEVSVKDGDIQDAVDVAGEGSTVRVKEGTYEGFTVSNTGLIIRGEESEITGTVDVDSSGVVLKGLRFDYEDDESNEQRILDLEDAGDNVEIRENYFTAPSDLLLRAAVIEGYTDGEDSTPQNWKFVGNEFEDISSTDNIVELWTVKDLVIKENQFTNMDLNENDGGSVISHLGVENSTIKRNNFTDVTSSAIYVDESYGGDDMSATNVDIKNNRFESIATGDLKYHQAAVNLGPGVGQGVTIENNNLNEKGNHSINVAEGVDEIQAEGNYFGSASGPSETQVRGDVDYRPWRMNAIDEEGYEEVITFSDNESWSAFSVVGAVDDAETASGDAEVLSYNAGWTSPSVKDMTSVDAAFVKDTKAVGVNYVEDPGTVSRSLGEGWNFVGAYDNGEDQAIRNVFGPVESSIDVFQRPAYNDDKTSERTTDLVTGNIISTSNWGSNSVFRNDASVFDGYWVKASENATLSTTPEPVEEG